MYHAGVGGTAERARQRGGSARGADREPTALGSKAPISSQSMAPILGFWLRAVSNILSIWQTGDGMGPRTKPWRCGRLPKAWRACVVRARARTWSRSAAVALARTLRARACTRAAAVAAEAVLAMARIASPLAALAKSGWLARARASEQSFRRSCCLLCQRLRRLTDVWTDGAQR